MTQLQVAVAGGGTCSASVRRTAADLGAALADAGATIICGGLGGVMRAVARGAAGRGGVVVGVLPGYDRLAANPYVSVALPTGLHHGRNVIVAASGDALVALPGGPGTLSEVALARTLGIPVVGLGAWGEVAGVHVVGRVAEAVTAVRRLIASRRGRAAGAG
jgi:uncharacterized protein (TIGR00725 family)